MSFTDPVVRHVRPVESDGTLGPGRNMTLERGASIPDGYVVLPKSYDRKKRWKQENGTFVEYADPDQAEALELGAIMRRQAAAPMVIAKISLKITAEAVTLAERIALSPLVTSITTLLQSGSFYDAWTTINAFPTTGLSQEALNVLVYADSLLDDAISEHY